METTIRGDQNRGIFGVGAEPSGVHHHRGHHHDRSNSENNNARSDSGVAGAVSGPASRRLVASAGVGDRVGVASLSRSVCAQERAFLTEPEAQTVPGTHFPFPHGFSSEEIYRWKRLEEQGAPLRAQRLDAIAKGDEEAERAAMEALKRLQRVKQLLLERMEELWTEEEWFASRQTHWERVRTSPSDDRSSTKLPASHPNEPAEAEPQPRPHTQGGVHFPPEIEAQPLQTPTREGVRSPQREEAAKAHELFDSDELLDTHRASHGVCDPHKSAFDPTGSALEADGQRRTVSSNRVRTGAESLTPSERVRSSPGTGKVPRDLPHFRGVRKDSIQDAAEFMERFETVCEPYSLDDAQLLQTPTHEGVHSPQCEEAVKAHELLDSDEL